MSNSSEGDVAKVDTDFNKQATLVTMGGTLDKDYFDALSTYEVADSTILADVKACGVDLSVDIVPVCRKDSLELDDSDRLAMCQAVDGLESPVVLISHGTDTMVESARFLSENSTNLGVVEKTVVFFGAMRPSRFKHSDAHFNFAFALGAAQSLSPGIYIAMSGQVFPHDAVQKNREQQRFESKLDESERG